MRGRCGFLFIKIEPFSITNKILLQILYRHQDLKKYLFSITTFNYISV